MTNYQKYQKELKQKEAEIKELKDSLQAVMLEASKSQENLDKSGTLGSLQQK